MNREHVGIGRCAGQAAILQYGVAEGVVEQPVLAWLESVDWDVAQGAKVPLDTPSVEDSVRVVARLALSQEAAG